MIRMTCSLMLKHMTWCIFALGCMLHLFFLRHYMISYPVRDATCTRHRTNDDIPTENSTMLSRHNLIDRVRKILLVAYFRGGSTFLGEAFNQNDDVFYWYEPLASQLRDMTNETDDAAVRVNSILKNIFNCELQALDKNVVEHFFITGWAVSRKFLPYKVCMQRNKINISFAENATKICLPIAIDACRMSPVRVIKTVKFGMHMATGLLDNVPDVHIIHYARDPRGLIVARHRLYEQPFIANAVHDEARTLCRRMIDDALWVDQLSSWPNASVLAKRYEDLAIDAHTTIEAIYTYLELEAPRQVYQYFNKITKADRDSTGQLSIVRANSSHTASKWRNVLPDDCSLSILRVRSCLNVLYKFNYDI